MWCVSRVLGPLPDHGFLFFDLTFPPREPWPKDVHSTQLTTVAATRQAHFYFHLNSQHLGKELGSYSGPTPAEGGEPAGSFCNLSLTWTQKTKVILSAAETQLPFMLPPGPPSRLLSSTEAPLSWKGTVASLPAPLPANRCAWRSLWTCPEHTGSFFSGPCSFGAARLVAWLRGSVLAKARRPTLLTGLAFAEAKVTAKGRPGTQFSPLPPGGAAKHRERLSHLSKQQASRKSKKPVY